MGKKPSNHGMGWTDAQLQKLGTLAAGNTPTRLIALKLGRTEAAVRQQAHEQGISLKPTNQSPYGPLRKK